jgi:hypothetical protein
MLQGESSQGLVVDLECVLQDFQVAKKKVSSCHRVNKNESIRSFFQWF